MFRRTYKHVLLKKSSFKLNKTKKRVFSYTINIKSKIKKLANGISTDKSVASTSEQSSYTHSNFKCQ